jgi:hypothetical protein
MREPPMVGSLGAAAITSRLRNLPFDAFDQIYNKTGTQAKGPRGAANAIQADQGGNRGAR